MLTRAVQHYERCMAFEEVEHKVDQLGRKRNDDATGVDIKVPQAGAVQRCAPNRGPSYMPRGHGSWAYCEGPV